MGGHDDRSKRRRRNMQILKAALLGVALIAVPRSPKAKALSSSKADCRLRS